MIEYYTGRDASLMTDNEIAMKIAHLERIRKMESINKIAENFKI